MKAIRCFLSILLVCFFVNVQGMAATKADDTAADSRKAHFILSARAGSSLFTDLNAYTTAGVGVALGGAMEFPMNARKTWHASVGVNFANMNMGLGYATVINGEKVDVSTHSFFVQVPVLFSYTKPLDDRCQFRVSFGLFLSQLLGGIENIYVSQGTVSSPTYKVSTILNAGFSAGTGFFFGNYYVGTNFTLMYDDYVSFLPTFNAVLGYRF